MAIEVQIDIEQIVRECEEELGRKLPTWKDRMEAVSAGAVDYDDIEHLLTVCAAIADEACEAERLERQAQAKAKGKMDITPTWRGMAVSYLRAMHNGGYTDGGVAIREVLVQMAETADWWLAEKARN